MSTPRKSTMVELVEELEKFESTDGIKFMLSEARAGEYHDFKNQKYVCGKVAVVSHLRAEAVSTQSKEVAAQLLALANRVMGGEFDEPADEQDKEQMRKDFPKKMHGVLGL